MKLQQRPCKSTAQWQETSQFRVPSGMCAHSACYYMHSVFTRSYAFWKWSWQEFKSDTEPSRISIVAYADDVTVFVTHSTNFITILNAIRTFEKATSTQISPQKSKALAVGTWTEPPTILGIDLCHQVKILRVLFGSTIATSTKGSWARVDAGVRTQARKAYDRSLCLARIQFVQMCLLAKMWYIAQILPPLAVHTPTADIDMFMVHMERSHISSTCQYTSAAKGSGRLDPFWHRGKMSDIIPQPTVDDEYEDRIRDCGYVTQMESGWPCGQSALCTSHPRQNGVHMSLRTGHGIYNTAKQQWINAQVQETTIWSTTRHGRRQ